MLKIFILALALVIVGVSCQKIPSEPVKKLCNDGLGECVPFTRCSNSTEFNDGSVNLNIRFGEEEEECHYLEFCCDPEDVIAIKEIPSVNPTTDFSVNRIVPETTDATLTDTFVPFVAPVDSFSSFHKIDETSGSNEAVENLFPANEIANEETVTIDPVANPIGGCDVICSGTKGESSKAPPSVETQTPPKEISTPVKETSTPAPAISTPSHTVTQTPTRLNSCDDELNECIPFYMCLNSTFNDGSELFNSRFSDHCMNDIEVCCDKSDNLKNYKPTRCGLRNEKGVGFQITNAADEAQYAEFPWMAALSEFNVGGNFDYICGGSLIHPSVVLTGAHCVKGRAINNINVRLGEWDTQTTFEIFPHSDHEVSEIITHADFGEKNLFNDVALLVLTKPAVLGPNINTVCLPPKTQKYDKNLCVASGWGADKFGQEGAYRVNLKKVQLPLVSQKECQDSLRTTKLGNNFKLNQSFMCAGGEQNIDTCTGDGGSPLVCPVPGSTDTYYQAGITAWGIECGQAGVPGVYANVARFRDWIDQQMNELGFGTLSYSI